MMSGAYGVHSYTDGHDNRYIDTGVFINGKLDGTNTRENVGTYKSYGERKAGKLNGKYLMEYVDNEEQDKFATWDNGKKVEDLEFKEVSAEEK